MEFPVVQISHILVHISYYGRHRLREALLFLFSVCFAFGWKKEGERKESPLSFRPPNMDRQREERQIGKEGEERKRIKSVVVVFGGWWLWMGGGIPDGEGLPEILPEADTKARDKSLPHFFPACAICSSRTQTVEAGKTTRNAMENVQEESYLCVQNL